MYRISIQLLTLSLLVFFLFCKPKKKEDEQIVGTRYARFDQYVSVVLGSEKRENKKNLLYAFEEVNVKETVEYKIKKYYHVLNERIMNYSVERLLKDPDRDTLIIPYIKNKQFAEIDEKEYYRLSNIKQEVFFFDEVKEYYRLTTVNGKEGFALSKNFSEAVYFVVKEVEAFRKPTLTAGTKGKLEISAICFQKEIQGEWSNVDCLGANSTEAKLEDWYDVWVQPNSESFAKNPLLGQTALELKEVRSVLIKLAQGTDAEVSAKLKSKAKELLTKSKERADLFLEKATEFETKLDSIP